MSRAWLSAGSCGLVLTLAVSARSRAGDDVPPPLEAPKNSNQAPAPVQVTQPTATSRKAPAVPRTTSRLLGPLRTETPVRVAPNALPQPQPAASRVSPALDNDAPPPLDAPAGLPDTPPLDAPSALPERPRVSVGGGISRRRVEEPDPVILSPIENTGDLPPALILTPEDKDRGEDEIRRSEPKHDTPAARKRFGLLPTPNTSRARNNGVGRDPAIRVEPRSDPAADAALKRKLEAKVNDAVGDRARDIEVRVIDRNVVIRAKVDRFWNRRNVRKTIETLPALSGYKTKVEIND